MSNKANNQSKNQPKDQQPKKAAVLPEDYKDYEADPKEAHLVHALIEQEVWDKGKKLSKATLQKFSQVAYANFIKNAGILGYTVTVLSTPKVKEPTPPPPPEE